MVIAAILVTVLLGSGLIVTKMIDRPTCSCAVTVGPDVAGKPSTSPRGALDR